MQQEEDIFVAFFFFLEELCLPCGFKPTSAVANQTVAKAYKKPTPHPWLSLSLSSLFLSWLKNGWWKIKNQFAGDEWFCGAVLQPEQLDHLSRQKLLNIGSLSLSPLSPLSHVSSDTKITNLFLQSLYLLLSTSKYSCNGRKTEHNNLERESDREREKQREIYVKRKKKEL